MLNHLNAIIFFIMFIVVVGANPAFGTSAAEKRNFKNQTYNIPGFQSNGQALTWDGKVSIRKTGLGWKITTVRPQLLSASGGAISGSAFSAGEFFAIPKNSRSTHPSEYDISTYESAHEINVNSVLNALAIVPSNPRNPGPNKGNLNGTLSETGNYHIYQMRIYTQEYGTDLNGNANTNPGMGYLDATIVVQNPDTNSSEIANTIIRSDFQKIRTVTGSFLPGIEPTLTFDGKLLIYNRNAPLNHILYSFNDDPSNNDGWSNPRFITQMYAQRNLQVTTTSGRTVRLGDLYRFANQPLRFANGVLVPTSVRFRGAYPWINLDGDDLFITTTVNKHEPRKFDTPALVALRAGQAVVGASTNGMVRHIDGGINRDRYGSLRLFVSSFGKMPGKWAPSNMTEVPLGPKPNTLPLLQSNTNKYSEVSFYETLSDNFDFYLPMNEAILRAAGTTAVNMDYALRQAQDISGNFHMAPLSNAQFSDEYIGTNPNYGGPGTSPINAETDNYCQLRCDNREDRYSGKAMYFSEGDSLTVPYRGGTGHLLLQGSHGFSLVFAIKPLRRGSPHVIMKMNNVFRVILSADNRIKMRLKSAPLFHNLMTDELPQDQWSHIALTYSSLGNGQLRTYVNGRQVSVLSNPAIGALSGVTKSAVVIGPSESSGSAMVYALDQVGMSPRILNTTEIRYEVLGGNRIFNSTNQTLPLGLKANDLKQGENLQTATIELGRHLFFDPRLSRDGTISCSSCHAPSQEFAGGIAIPRGLNNQFVTRNAPSIYNLSFMPSYFHDGRVENLPGVVNAVMTNPREFGTNFVLMENYIQTQPKYNNLFNNAGLAKNRQSVFRAISQFVASLKSGNSKADQVEEGTDTFTAAERQGRILFHGKARCAECHNGSNLTDGGYHNVGLVNNGDPGRSNFTGLVRDQFKFKTPSLRNIARTAPYMHDGSVDNLRRVVELYNDGVNATPRPQDPIMRPLGLADGEINNLVAYLNTLNGDLRPNSDFNIPATDYSRQLQYNKGAFSMTSGDTRRYGQSNEYRLVYQTDGNLVIYYLNRPVMSTGTGGRNCQTRNCRLVFQGTDGNLVMYINGRAYWHTGTGRTGQTVHFNNRSPYLQVRDSSGVARYSK